MGKKANNTYIFSKLVDSKDDIRGHIAYAIYKFEKVSHIEEFKKTNKREPNASEKEEFRAICCNPVRLEEYKTRADMILDAFSNELLNEAANQIERDYIKGQEEHLKEVFRQTNPSLLKQYLHGIAQSMLGTIILALLIWLLVDVVSKNNVEDLLPKHQDEQVLGK